MAAVTQVNLQSLKKIASGKVRDLFTLPNDDTLLFVASDRVSAFDVSITSPLSMNPHQRVEGI